MALHKYSADIDERSGLLLRTALIALAAAATVFSSLPLYASESENRANVPAMPVPGREKGAQAQDAEALAESAVNTAVELMGDYPDRIETIAMVASTYRRLGLDSKAEKYWRQCLERDSKYAEAYIGLGGIKFRRGEDEQALALYQQALAVDPNNPKASSMTGLMLVRLGRFEEAVETLEANLSRGSQAAVQTYLFLGQSFLQLKLYDKAAESYEKARQLAPETKAAWYGLATTYARLGQHDKAAEARKQFAKLSSSEMAALERSNKAYDDIRIMRRYAAQINTEVGLHYGKFGNHAKAESLLRKAASIDPNDPVSRRYLANLYRKTNKGHEAVLIYKEIVRIEPGNPANFLQMGLASAEGGLFEEAESAFRKVIQMAPERPEGYHSLSMLLLLTNKKPVEAQKFAEMLVERDPRAGNYFILARTCIANADRKGALAALSRAIRLDPNNTTYKSFYEQILDNK